MAAVQRLRASARANGRLASTPQQKVSAEAQGGQQAIVIKPANANLVYVPSYDPSYVWGRAECGSYATLSYPSNGTAWGSGTDLAYWGGNWGDSDDWGWGSNWYGGIVYVNNYFFRRHGFHGDWDRGSNRERWEHNPDHRLGVPYADRQLADRYQAASAASLAKRGGFGVNRPNVGGNALPGARPDNRPGANRQATPGNPQGFREMSPGVSPRGGAARSFPAPPSGGKHGFGGAFGGAPPMQMGPPPMPMAPPPPPPPPPPGPFR
jgi:hypothetical protein